MSIMSSRNLTMMTDLYQLTMMYGYFKKGMAGNKAVFDLFFRDTKANSSYAVMRARNLSLNISMICISRRTMLLTCVRLIFLMNRF